MEGRTQPLNAKDTETFQLALTFYEKKEYQKSLNEVNTIIKRRKERIHGESLCLKALDMFHLNMDNDEVRRLMDEGSKADSKSPVAWHMRGILYKLMGEYAEAYRSYCESYALKKENPNVLQDLAMLAAQQRDFRTLVDVRAQILGQRMSMRMSWTALAAAQFLRRDFHSVEKTIELYEQVLTVERASAIKTQTKQEILSDEIEMSELLMLRSRALMAQPGQEKRALADLDKIKPRVRDLLAWSEHRAALLARTDQEAAYSAYLELLERNSDNADYYKALESLKSDHKQLYTELQQKFPKADLPFARPLLLFEYDSPGWDEALFAYLNQKLQKRVPSTFMLVEPLYSDEHKRRVLNTVVEEKLALQKEQDPALVAFYAHHLSRTGRQTEAVEHLSKAKADDEDTKVDLELAKAKLLQNAGAYKSAAKVLKEVSEKALGDRYLNTKASEAYFLANDVDNGYQEAFKFPKWGKHATTDAEALKHLEIMESVNVLTAATESHHRRREHGLALKRALKVLDIINGYFKEQYDFHFFGPKRGSLRMYVDLLAWEDNLYSSSTYFRALKVAAHEWCAQSRHESDGLSEKVVAARKKARASQLETVDFKDDADPFGIGTLEAKDGLERAYAAWKHIESSDTFGTDPEAWLLAFRILLCQKKYVLASQALKKARDFGASVSEVCAGGVMARYALELDDTVQPVVRQLQLKMLPTIVTTGNIVGDELVDYVKENVKNLGDYVEVRRFMDSMHGVEAEAVSRIDELKEVEEIERVLLELRRGGTGDAFEEAVKSKWTLFDQEI